MARGIEVRLIRTDVAVCHQCKGGALLHTISVPASVPVQLLDCAECDRSQCHRCAQAIDDVRARRCEMCGEIVPAVVRG